VTTKKDGPPKPYAEVMMVSCAWRWVPAHWVDEYTGSLYTTQQPKRYVRGRWVSYVVHRVHKIIELSDEVVA